MKQLKFLAVFVALLFGVKSASAQTVADAADLTESLETGDTIIETGYIYRIANTGNGDAGLIFVSEDGLVLLLASSLSFDPETYPFDSSTLIELQAVVLLEANSMTPPIVQVDLITEVDPASDRDGDGIPDSEDFCPDDPLPQGESNIDNDEDGIGNHCDPYFAFDDVDNDGIPDDTDLCPEAFNPNDPFTGEQSYPVDTDGDGIGDVCADEDGDGIDDALDICPLVINEIDPETGVQLFPIDTDGDGIGDVCEEPIPFVDENGNEYDRGEGEGFYCRNRDIQHPAGARIADAYDVDYESLIAEFCGEDGHRRGWGWIRNHLHRGNSEIGARHGRGNGNANGNRNGNGNGNGNSNGNGHGRGN